MEIATSMIMINAAQEHEVQDVTIQHTPSEIQENGTKTKIEKLIFQVFKCFYTIGANVNPFFRYSQ